MHILSPSTPKQRINTSTGSFIKVICSENRAHLNLFNIMFQTCFVDIFFITSIVYALYVTKFDLIWFFNKKNIHLKNDKSMSPIKTLDLEFLKHWTSIVWSIGSRLFELLDLDYSIYWISIVWIIESGKFGALYLECLKYWISIVWIIGSRMF